MDPKASRETLDHSLPYIFAVALEDGRWHHNDSYTPERAGHPQTVKLWHKIKTCEEKIWTDMYNDPDPRKKAFGGRVCIEFKDGTVIKGEKKWADAHPSGKSPFQKEDYIQKFLTLSEGVISKQEAERFLDLVQNLEYLSHEDICQLNVDANLPIKSRSKGIF